jgi:hypothetical protein
VLLLLLLLLPWLFLSAPHTCDALLSEHPASAAIRCSLFNYFAQRVSQNSSSVENCTMPGSHLHTSLRHWHLSCRKEEESFATAETAAAGPAIDSKQSTRRQLCVNSQQRHHSTPSGHNPATNTNTSSSSSSSTSSSSGSSTWEKQLDEYCVEARCAGAVISATRYWDYGSYHRTVGLGNSHTTK